MTLGFTEDRDAIEQAQTLLFVPGVRSDRYDKAHSCGVDATILDLEDSVAPDQKAVARDRVAAWLAEGHRHVIVRTNAARTPWFRDDLLAAKGSSGIMLPKAESVDDIDNAVAALGTEHPIIALIETARGLLAAAEICRHPQVVRAAFGNIDFASDIGVDPADWETLSNARSHLVCASRASGCVGPIDGVTTAIADAEALTRDARRARAMGFTAKLLIHPSQVQDARAAMLPTPHEQAWATDVLAAVKGGVGVVAGEMVDEPVLARARQILRLAARA